MKIPIEAEPIESALEEVAEKESLEAEEVSDEVAIDEEEELPATIEPETTAPEPAPATEIKPDCCHYHLCR